MLNSFKFWAVWAIVLGIIALLAFGFTTDPKIVPSPLIGRPAPNFKVDELNGGKQFSLNEFKGIPIVLNFWASWCAECQTEAFILEDFYQKYGVDKKQLVMIGIAIQDSPKKARTFARHFGKTYLLGLDDEAGNIALDYGIYGVPETFLINSQGNVELRYAGPITNEVLRNLIQPKLNELGL